VLPALLLLARLGARGAAEREAEGGRGGGDRARAARALPRPGADDEAGSARAARRRLLQRGGHAARRRARDRKRRRPGGRRAERRDPRGARGRRRDRGAGPDRRRRSRAAAAAAARARAPRPRPARRGLRAARGERGGYRRTRARLQGAARPPARRPGAADRALDRGASGCRTRAPAAVRVAGGGPMSRPLVLAIDGGNWKTDLALVQADGRVLALVRGPQSSPHHLGLDGSLLVLGWGVGVVCGAGINCVGVAPDGRQARFPALGWSTGDWGGGHDVGIAAVEAAARSEDGRGERTTLEQAVPAHFGQATPSTLAEAFHSGRIVERRVVELAPVVFAEAGHDAVAAAIVDRLADEVVTMVRVTLERLELSGEPVEVALGGGLMQSGDPGLIGAIEAGIKEIAPAAT